MRNKLAWIDQERPIAGSYINHSSNSFQIEALTTLSFLLNSFECMSVVVHSLLVSLFVVHHFGMQRFFLLRKRAVIWLHLVTVNSSTDCVFNSYLVSENHRGNRISFAKFLAIHPISDTDLSVLKWGIASAWISIIWEESENYKRKSHDHSKYLNHKNGVYFTTLNT